MLNRKRLSYAIFGAARNLLSFLLESLGPQRRRESRGDQLNLLVKQSGRRLEFSDNSDLPGFDDILA